MARQTILTGIKPTGRPHIANYIGAIKPALRLAEAEDTLALYFIANYHALNLVYDPQELEQLTYEVAATWIALGLDPARVVFYRQSDVPDVFELAWILSCFTGKGLMNRAHAYKAAVARNQEAGERDLDAGINMGLYCYPILMAADILLFDTDIVPVGQDQVQHVEIARDIAQRFNQNYGPTLNLPNHRVDAEIAALPGLDGRKMSKSYNNAIPIFSSPKETRQLVMRYKTDSSSPTEPKDPASSPLFLIYKEFASPAQTAAMRQHFLTGIGWGQVKEQLADVLNTRLDEPRRIYANLMPDRSRIEKLLAEGADKARTLARPTMERVRIAIGAR